MDQSDYDYTTSGFDGFLSRSVGSPQQDNLSTGGVQSNQIAYDRMQVSGALGDSIQVGKIRIDGVKGRISVSDDNGNEVIRIGELDG
jgi:hypothetical protein